MKDRLAARRHEQHEVAPHDVQIHENELPVNPRVRRILDRNQNGQSESPENGHRRRQCQRDPREPLTACRRHGRSHAHAVASQKERKHERRLLRSQSTNPRGNSGEEPPSAAVERPPSNREECNQQERRAEDVGAPADVPDGFRHHRVDGKHPGRGRGNDVATQTCRMPPIDVLCDRRSRRRGSQ